jgi:AbiV family abortive infection protein
MTSAGIQANLTHDSESGKWRVVANNVSDKTLKQEKSDISTFSAAHSYDHLSIQTIDDMFDFSEAPLECLDEFPGNPRDICFPPVSTLSDGLTKSLENSLQLANSVDILFHSQKGTRNLGLMNFLLLTSLEEIGKACMILAAAKEAERKGWKTGVIRGLRKHSKKFSIAGKQLKALAVQLNLFDHAAYLHDLAAKIPGEADGVFGKWHREYGLYVGYSAHGKRWRTPQTQYAQSLVSGLQENTIESWVSLLKTACDAFSQESKNKPLHQVRELKDIFDRPF